MADIIINGGPTVNERVRVGPTGELRHDTSNGTVRLHDGSTPGGTQLLSREAADSLYVGSTADLLALRAPDENDLGFMTRTGEGSYRYRTLSADANNITVSNPNGEAGNPTIGLKPTVVSAHTWQAPQTFSGGLVGDLTGNVTGNVLGNTNGIHTGPVVGNVTGDVVGGLDARGEPVFFDPGAIPIGAVAGLAAILASLETALPVGLIMMWSGSVASIPSGWALCDGQNGTPNLTDRFVIGAGNNYAPGNTGGASSHTHTATAADAGSHQHSITVDGHALTINQLPQHTHTSGVTDNSQTDVFNRATVAANPTTPNSIESNSADGVWEGTTGPTGGGAPHSHTASSGASGTHTHALSVAAQNNLPPYYALCYIMVIS